jgi:hypothetical protein
VPFQSNRRSTATDAELFVTVRALVEERSAVFDEHVADLPRGDW